MIIIWFVESFLAHFGRLLHIGDSAMEVVEEAT